MRVLLTAINAKYIHSNLAVYSLRAYAAPYRDRIETAEFTINQQQDYILQRIYEKKPDILAFSCYIWNVETVLSLVRDITLVLPETKIWLGGPEVSYNGEELLKTYPEITGIMRGEGEQSFLSLLEYYLDGRGDWRRRADFCSGRRTAVWAGERRKMRFLWIWMNSPFPIRT